MYKPVPYHIAAAGVYGCIVILCALALYYGLRAKRNVKKEKVTALARGFSPLDIQRIFIGKTYPRKLTRALIVHWAQLGYLRVEYVSKYRVKLVCLRKPPEHNEEKAVFFDRGTYVRERDLFNEIFSRQGEAKTVNILKALFKRDDVRSINASYAVREDEGVYSSKHYKLKVFSFILSVMPFFINGAYLCATGSFVGVIMPFVMFVGMFVFRFLRELPIVFRTVWSAFWVIPMLALMIVFFNDTFDPLFLGWASVVMLLFGGFVLIRFVDYREKNNLTDYSDLINYKKYLLYTNKKILKDVDYYEVLPYLYTFNIKVLVKRKFNTDTLPDWYVSDNGKRGKLL